MKLTITSVRAAAARAACFSLMLSLGTQFLVAQKPEARILAPVDNSVRSTLAGSHPAVAQAANDAGRMSPSAQLQGVSIFFSRSVAQQSALDALIAAQQNPASPQYHQWLGPDQFAAEFGAADADLVKVQGWLQRQGFTVDEVSRNRSMIRFSGNVAQIEAAFGTEMHYFTVQGAKHFAPASDLSVPAAFAQTVMAVGNLSDFRPRPHVKIGAPVKVTSNFTSSQSGNHFVTPKDVATIYDINAAYNTGWTGSGQSITAIGQSAILTSDITNFQTAAGTPVRAPNIYLMPNTGTSTIYSGDEVESDLDLEYSSAIARGAVINFVYTGSSPNYGAFDALAYAVTNNLGTIISVSYGECEPNLGSAGYAQYNASGQQAAVQGQTIVAASGDAGSVDCYPEVSSGTLTPTQLAAQQATEATLAVDWPASSQYVTGLGGTEFPTADVSASNTTYWIASTGTDVISSATQYIPEMVWNDDAAASGLSAGGGGVSTFTARPTWQTGVPGIPSGSSRLVPDIALASSPNNAGYLYCSSDTSTGITGSCANGFRDVSNVNLTIAGGTSFAAPIFSGMLALINQSKGSAGQGIINPTLYTLAANPATYASAFHDITTGNNGCVAGTAYALTFNSSGSPASYGPACTTTAAGQYAATTGYDQVTGLGSVDLNNLLTAWPGTTVAAPASFSLSAPAVAITAGSSGTAAITITPKGGYTGTVKITISTNPLITYACYTSATASVAGTSAVTASITVYTTAATCPTNGVSLAQTGGKVAASTAPPQPGSRQPGRLPAGIAMAGLLAIGLVGRRSKRLRGMIAVAVLAIAGFGLSGCGSGSTAGAGIVGTTSGSTSGTAAKGTYSVSVTGTDTSSGATATTAFTLTIQ